MPRWSLSCFPLPKLSSFLCNYNLVPLISYETFDSIILSSLSDSIGARLLSWSCSRPHSQSQWVVSGYGKQLYTLLLLTMLLSAALPQSLRMSFGSTPILAPFLDAYCPLLSLSAAMPEWISHQDIDVSISQRSLSSAIDKASFSSLLAQAPDVHSWALALSSAIRHSVCPVLARNLCLQWYLPLSGLFLPIR